MRPSLFFLASDGGKVLITQFEPIASVPPRINVIVVPPFCEEMNKSRKMVTTFARRAAAQRIKVSLIDLSGTGDSEGELSNATWEDWQHNIVALYRELKRQNPKVPLTILGIRTGALLALDLCVKNMVNPLDLLFWQPVLNGKQFINQFMRMRLAAEMISSGPKFGNNELLEELNTKGCVEIAGYNLSKNLIDQISSINHAALDTLPESLNVAWYEVGQAPKESLLPISQKVVEKWRETNDVFSQFIVGDTFWQTQEITLVEELTSNSLDYLLGRPDE